MLSTTKIKSTIEPWFGLPTVSTGAAHLALAAAAVAVAFLLALAFANGCLRWISLCIALAQKRIRRMQLQGAGAVMPKVRRLAAWTYGPGLTRTEVERLVAKTQRWRRVRVLLNDNPMTTVTCKFTYHNCWWLNRTWVLPRLLLQDEWCSEHVSFRNLSGLESLTSFSNSCFTAKTCVDWWGTYMNDSQCA